MVSQWSSCLLFGKKLVIGQKALLVNVWIVVAIFGLCGIGGKQYARLRWTINILDQNSVLDLKEEHAQRDILNDLLANIFWKVFGAKFELKRTLFGNVLAEDFFVEFEPGEKALGVLVLEAKVPDLSQSDCLDHLSKSAQN